MFPTPRAGADAAEQRHGDERGHGRGNSWADRASPLRGLIGWGSQDKANNADSTPVMTQQQSSDDNARAPIDRSRASRGGGSIGVVLLIALVLVGAAVVLLLIGRAKAEPYILTLLAVLATLGVFLLFALAAGILRASGREAASPLLEALVDLANEGILVTDPHGRVVYANATYLDLVEASGPQEVRPVERVFMGDPGVSEAVYRLLKAAREGRRGQEDVRIGAHKGASQRWLRIRVRPLGEGKRESRMTVWSLADVTRELERHENVSQELQHAVDYLDHAPAGFFRPRPTAISSISTPRSPIGSTTISRRSAPPASSSTTSWRARARRCSPRWRRCRAT